MRLIIIGCEYAGKSTLTAGIKEWLIETMGSCQTSFHDHFVLPFKEGFSPQAEEQAQQILNMDRTLLERHVDYMMNYHLSPGFYMANDHCLVNWYFGDAVYAEMYYGYGGPGEYAERRVMARYYDKRVMECAPDTVLVLMKASAEVIIDRMRENPHPHNLIKEEDVPKILDRFEEEHASSLLRRKIVLDTTDSTPAATLEEFLLQIEAHLSDRDLRRIVAHKALHT